MTAVVITPSVDRAWIRPLASFRQRGISTVVIWLDPLSFAQAAAGAVTDPAELSAAALGVPDAQQGRALRHALAEYDLRMYTVKAGTHLAEALAR
jgi:hypothetical protein